MLPIPIREAQIQTHDSSTFSSKNPALMLLNYSSQLASASADFLFQKDGLKHSPPRPLHRRRLHLGLPEVQAAHLLLLRPHGDRWRAGDGGGDLPETRDRARGRHLQVLPSRRDHRKRKSLWMQASSHFKI